jgi:hypothetical protein
MNFGLYIGSVAGTDKELVIGEPDNPHKIHNALENLEQGRHSLIIRGYIHYLGEGEIGNEAPENIIQYATITRKIDLVICYRSVKYDHRDWTTTIRKVIEKYGDHLHSIQIGEEPNLKDVYSGDGSFDNIEEALFDGILAAKEKITKSKNRVQIGFNTALSFNPNDTFWNIIGSDNFKLFREAIDYIGLDFFPDVFRPLPEEGFPGNLTSTVKYVLHHFRNVVLNSGKIPLSVPVCITENGWSTGGSRSYERQALIIETIIRALNEVKHELNIRSYELFSLRDADSKNDDLFYQFGILKDDYTPKPAFHKFRELIQELGGG